MQKYNNLNEALEKLKEDGYTHIFNKGNDCIYCTEPPLNFRTHELEITEVYRSAMAVSDKENASVYAIESTRLGIKGLLVNEYIISKTTPFVHIT